MSFPHGCWIRSPGLRVRPVPELRHCLVYRPRPPRLFKLNLAAWLVLELCDGRERALLVDGYRNAAGNHVSTAEVSTHVDLALAVLAADGLIRDRGDIA